MIPGRVREALFARYWSWVAPKYQAKMARRRTTFAVQNRCDWFAARCPRRGTLLDVACGSGAYSVALAERGFDVFGIDLAKGMIAVARTQAAKVQPPATAPRFQVADAADPLPFADASFDDAICIMALHHMPHPGSTLAEIRRVLRPGGYLHLLTLGAGPALPRKGRRESGLRRALWVLPRRGARRLMWLSTPESLELAALAAGFQLVERGQGDRRGVEALFTAV